MGANLSSKEVSPIYDYCMSKKEGAQYGEILAKLKTRSNMEVLHRCNKILICDSPSVPRSLNK